MTDYERQGRLLLMVRALHQLLDPDGWVSLCPWGSDAWKVIISHYKYLRWSFIVSEITMDAKVDPEELAAGYLRQYEAHLQRKPVDG